MNQIFLLLSTFLFLISNALALHEHSNEEPIIPPSDVNLNIREPPEELLANHNNENTHEALMNEENSIPPRSLFSYCSSHCPFEKQCLFAQVSSNFTNYGCSLCTPSHYLQADASGSGKCKAKKNPNDHCIASQTFPSFNKNSLHCWACETDYILSRDLSNCKHKIKQNKKIEHCDHYYQSGKDKDDVVCNACEDGYTLSNDMKKCTKGCELQNCAKCQMLEDAPFCFMCKKDYIGILNQNVYLYTDCMSCDDIKERACNN